jgi:oligosaccharide repeat unit polymerase
MTIISAISFLAVFTVLVSCIRTGMDVLSPTRVFVFIWGLSIGLAEFKFSLYQHEWTWYGWAMILLGVGSFLVGVFAFGVSYSGRRLLTIDQVRDRIRESITATIDEDRFYRALVGLFLAYIVAYTVEVAITGNVPIFAKNPERLRVTFGVFGIHLFVTTMLSIMIFSLEYFLFFPARVTRRIVVAVIFFMTSATFFLLLQRYSFAFWALLALAITYYGSRKLRLRTILIAAACMAGFLMLIQSIRTAIYVEQYVYVISKMKYSREFAAFTEPYMYIVMNVENVARSVERLDHFYFGYFTFDWVVALSGLKHWWAEYLNIDRLPFLNSDYNTYAFQWTFYYDFGPFGLAIIPLILGLFTGFSYYRLRTTPNVLFLYAYAIMFVFMITSFREVVFTRLDAISNFALMWGIHRFVAVKRSVPRPV